MRTPFRAIAALLLAGWSAAASAQDKVYSGPQPGEKITPFKVLAVRGAGEGAERDPVAEAKGEPVVLVFLHAVERSLVPLLRVIDEYGAERKEHLRTEVVFLMPDRLAGEQRAKTVSNALKLKSSAGLSLDGAEGPGNYGLNKECMMTIVAAKDNRVTANFALVQPGISDAPEVLAALARLSGDEDPPSVETLAASRPGMRGRMRRERMERGQRREGAERFPGAVPADQELVSMLRSFIRKENEPSDVDAILARVREHIRGNAELKRQAIGGWTRILHFGDRYGTPYAREAGAAFLKELQKK